MISFGRICWFFENKDIWSISGAAATEQLFIINITVNCEEQLLLQILHMCFLATALRFTLVLELLNDLTCISGSC